MTKELTVLIVEDAVATKEILAKYFNDTQVTYANIIPASARQEIVEKLDEIQES